MDGMAEVDVRSLRDIRSREDCNSSHEAVLLQTDYAKNLQQAWEGAVGKTPSSPSVKTLLEERKWPEKGKNEQEHEAIGEEGKEGSSTKLHEDMPIPHDKDGKSGNRGPCFEPPVTASEQYSDCTECIDSSGLGSTDEGRINNDINVKCLQHWNQPKQEEEQNSEHNPRRSAALIDEQVPPPPPPSCTCGSRYFYS